MARVVYPHIDTPEVVQSQADDAINLFAVTHIT